MPGGGVEPAAVGEASGRGYRPARRLGRLETVTVRRFGRSHDTAEITLAIRTARCEDARSGLLHNTVAGKASVTAIERYRTTLSEPTGVPTESVVEQANGLRRVRSPGRRRSRTRGGGLPPRDGSPPGRRIGSSRASTGR